MLFDKIVKKKFANTTIIFWGEFGNQVLEKKISILIEEIKPYKKKFLGISNPPAAFGFVPEAMEVHGKVLDPKTGKDQVFFLVPEFVINAYQPQDRVVLSISQKGYCFNIEKI